MVVRDWYYVVFILLPLYWRCAICFEEFQKHGAEEQSQDDQFNQGLTPSLQVDSPPPPAAGKFYFCSHVFHQACTIDKDVIRCPMCREGARRNARNRVYLNFSSWNIYCWWFFKRSICRRRLSFRRSIKNRFRSDFPRRHGTWLIKEIESPSWEVSRRRAASRYFKDSFFCLKSTIPDPCTGRMALGGVDVCLETKRLAIMAWSAEANDAGEALDVLLSSIEVLLASEEDADDKRSESRKCNCVSAWSRDIPHSFSTWIRVFMAAAFDMAYKNQWRYFKFQNSFLLTA